MIYFYSRMISGIGDKNEILEDDSGLLARDRGDGIVTGWY